MWPRTLNVSGVWWRPAQNSILYRQSYSMTHRGWGQLIHQIRHRCWWTTSKLSMPVQTTNPSLFFLKFFQVICTPCQQLKWTVTRYGVNLKILTFLRLADLIICQVSSSKHVPTIYATLCCTFFVGHYVKAFFHHTENQLILLQYTSLGEERVFQITDQCH